MSLTREDKLAIAAEADRICENVEEHTAEEDIVDVDRALAGAGGSDPSWHQEVRRLAALRAAPPADLLSPEERATVEIARRAGAYHVGPVGFARLIEILDRHFSR